MSCSGTEPSIAFSHTCFNCFDIAPRTTWVDFAFPDLEAEEDLAKPKRAVERRLFNTDPVVAPSSHFLRFIMALIAANVLALWLDLQFVSQK